MELQLSNWCQVPTPWGSSYSDDYQPSGGLGSQELLVYQKEDHMPLHYGGVEDGRASSFVCTQGDCEPLHWGALEVGDWLLHHLPQQLPLYCSYLS